MLKKKILEKIIYPFIDSLSVKKNKIVFDNFSGRGYGCNPKYIAEALRNIAPDLDLVWLCRSSKEIFPTGIRVVKFDSIRARYEWATAAIWIDNIRNTPKAPKKPNQFYIQTWHSSLGIKKVEAAAGKLKPEYEAAAKFDAKITDLMIANNQMRFMQFQKDFWYDGKILICGTPRNSILFQINDNTRNCIYTKLGIKQVQKIVLYAPTFRNNSDSNIYWFDYMKCIKSLETRFGGDFVLLFRLHPNAVSLRKNFKFNDKIMDVTDYPDIQELIAISHIIITDYSSCMFDAAFVKKPVFLYATDINYYINNDQGLLFNYYELPFSISSNTEQLQTAIKNFDEKVYSEKCNYFFDYIGLAEDGNGDKFIANVILQQLNKK